MIAQVGRLLKVYDFCKVMRCYYRVTAHAKRR